MLNNTKMDHDKFVQWYKKQLKKYFPEDLEVLLDNGEISHLFKNNTQSPSDKSIVIESYEHPDESSLFNEMRYYENLQIWWHNEDWSKYPKHYKDYAHAIAFGLDLSSVARRYGHTTGQKLITPKDKRKQPYYRKTINYTKINQVKAKVLQIAIAYFQQNDNKFDSDGLQDT